MRKFSGRKVPSAQCSVLESLSKGSTSVKKSCVGTMVSLEQVVEVLTVLAVRGIVLLAPL